MSEARHRTRNLMVASRIRFCCTTTGTPHHSCLRVTYDFTTSNTPSTGIPNRKLKQLRKSGVKPSRFQISSHHRSAPQTLLVWWQAPLRAQRRVYKTRPVTLWSVATHCTALRQPHLCYGLCKGCALKSTQECLGESLSDEIMGVFFYIFPMSYNFDVLPLV